VASRFFFPYSCFLDFFLVGPVFFSQNFFLRLFFLLMPPPRLPYYFVVVTILRALFFSFLLPPPDDASLFRRDVFSFQQFFFRGCGPFVFPPLIFGQCRTLESSWAVELAWSDPPTIFFFQAPPSPISLFGAK